MKRIGNLLLTLVLLLSLTACGSNTWQEKYDLGERYLGNGEYVEAILAFEAAIEIDPRQPEAYLGLAYAYIGQNDFDAAREILERGYELTQDEVLKAKLEELDSGNISDYAGNIRKTSFYDGSGALQGYHTFTYDSQNRKSSVTSFDAEGNQTGHVDLAYDADGRELISYTYFASGPLASRMEHEYDEDGKCIKNAFYDLSTNELDYYDLYQYDEQGRMIREDRCDPNGEIEEYHEYSYTENSKRKDCYRADGELDYYQVWNYDGNGRLIDYYGYGADGTLSWRNVYQYDDAGNRIGWEEYDGEGNLTGSTVYN